MNTTRQRPFEVTHRSVVALAWPTTLAYMTTPILGLVDTGVVGRMGDAALLGGLAVGAVLFDIIFATFNFLRAGTTGLVAQAFGADDDETQKLVLLRSLLISICLGLVIMVAAPLVLQAGLWTMAVPQNIATATATYFAIRILGAPLTLINYSVLGWMLGLGRAGQGLLLQTVLNGSNIVLSIWLGLYLEWGIAGVAWATICAEAIAATFGLIFIGLHYGSQTRPRWSEVLDPQALKRLFSVNRDLMVRSFLLLFTFGFFTAQGAKFGEITLAANAVLMNFFLISGYFLDGFATAAEQLVGRAIGARYRPAFERAVKLTLFWGFVLSAFATLVFFVAGPMLIDILALDPQVRSQARVYLPWAALTASAGVLAFQMDGVYIGTTWTADMRNMMILSFGAFLLTWYLTVLTIGNHGLWLAIEVFLIVRGVTLFAMLPKNTRRTFG